MSRENPNVTKRVTATLTGEKRKYTVELILSCMEMWNGGDEPADIVVLNQGLAATNPVVVADGSYLMEYSFAGKPVTINVQIFSANLHS
jgi:hypothetical protein